jgi:hypothetical protein
MAIRNAVSKSPDTLTKESRRAKRHRTRIKVIVDLKGRHTAGTIHDLSTTGMCLELEHSFFGPPGCVVSIESHELGCIEAVVRWNTGRRLGVSFTSPAASAAQVQAYFRFFHRNPAAK